MAEPLLDRNRPDDAHTDARLNTEPVIWLGTTCPDARPHQVPVWFCWHDPEILIFSMPATRKVRNLRRNPRVALTLDSAVGVYRLSGLLRSDLQHEWREVPRLISVLRTFSRPYRVFKLRAPSR